MQTGILGNLTLNPRGAWSASEAPYKRLDYVGYNGSSWTALSDAGSEDVPGISPVWMASSIGSGPATVDLIGVVKPDGVTTETDASGTISVTDAKLDTADFEAFNSFSLSETDTGQVWIDGKKIYRKVVNFGGLPNNTTKNVPHGISGTFTVVRLWGVGLNPSIPSSIPLPYASGSATCSLSRTGANILITSNYDFSANTQVYVIFEYTKG